MKTNTILCLLFIILFASCTDTKESEDDLTLEGAWELVSGEWNFGGEPIVFPRDTFNDLRSYKFFSNSHWAVLGQVPSDTMHWGHGGKYKLKESKYVEYFEIAKNPNMMGDSVVFEITLTKNEMKISNDSYKETWKRID